MKFYKNKNILVTGGPGMIGIPLVKMLLEFGAWDGIYISNTYQLWRYENFNALLIEPPF